MIKREQQVAKARALLGNDRIIAFFRACRASSQEVLACKLINDELDAGDDFDKIFFTGVETGYRLTASLVKKNKFVVNFGCVAGPEAGDGGRWVVCFSEDERVESLEPISAWMA